MDRTVETATFATAGGGAGSRLFFSLCAALFAASVAVTIRWCGSMDGGMEMPGGWAMSMAWMRMPGQTWFGAAATFMGMWVVMMVAMMLPSLLPVLANYRRELTRLGVTHVESLATVLAGGYFLAWTACGAVVYPGGVLTAAAEMHWPALARHVPLATGLALLIAGCFQLTNWKARHLGCCRGSTFCARVTPPSVGNALRDGARFGIHCISCCCGFMLTLLVSGVMNLWLMGVLAIAITMERLLPWPARVARLSGCAIVAAGIVLIVQASR